MNIDADGRLIGVVRISYWTASWSVPVTVRYVARTMAVPEERPVTTPVEETVATEVSEDCQVA
jgi:hypothetical protein